MAHIAVTVEYGVPLLSPSPLLPEAALSDNGSYILLMYRAFFFSIIMLGEVLTLMENDVFDIKKVYVIINCIALGCVGNVALSLLMQGERPMRGMKCLTLKFVGSVSAFLAPFSLMMVLVPPELDWVGYLAMWLMFGIIVTCLYLDDEQLCDKKRSVINALVSVLIFLLPFGVYIVHGLFDIDAISYHAIYLCLGMENAYHLITCLMFIAEKIRRKSKVYQQDDDEKKYPRNNYLEVLG